MLFNLNCFKFTNSIEMPAIAHQVWIEATQQQVFDAVTLSEGLSRWWLKDCTAKPETGFVNEFFVDGHIHNKMLITGLQRAEFVEWTCINDNGLWSGNRLTFRIRKKNGLSILDFKHGGWEQETDFFAICSFHWARHLLMLKAYCETGKDQIDAEIEGRWMAIAQKVFS
jgi:uncharacterized protein YndB with AHSA1/START domain